MCIHKQYESSISAEDDSPPATCFHSLEELCALTDLSLVSRLILI